MEYKKNKNFKIYKSIEFIDFLSLLKHCQFFIEILQLVLLRLHIFTAFINIGNRQNGRDELKMLLILSLTKNLF